MGSIRPYISERPRLNRKTSVFLACVGLSAFLWLLMSLSKEYEETLALPVEFIGLPQDRVLMNELPNHLDMQVEALGFDVLLHWLHIRRQPLVIDLAEEPLPKTTVNGVSLSYLLTARKLHLTEDLTASSMKVLRLMPDTLYFRLVPRKSRKIPVKLVADISYDEDVVPDGRPVLEPSHVTVHGPQELLSELDSVLTEEVRWTGISDSIVQNLALIPLPDPKKLTMEETEVRVRLGVIQVSTIEFSTTVNLKGRRADRKWVAEPERVEVTVKTTANYVGDMVPGNFSFVVETGKDSQNGDALEVRCVEKPGQVLGIEWEPKTVKIRDRD